MSTLCTHLLPLVSLSVCSTCQSQRCEFPAPITSEEPNPASSSVVDDPTERDAYYRALLQSVRTLSGLRRLTLQTVPLAQAHLDALIGDEAEGRQKAAIAAAAAARTVAMEVEGLDRADVSRPSRSVLRLDELHLSELGFARSGDPTSIESRATTDEVGFGRLMQEHILPRTCVITTYQVLGLSLDMCDQWRAHFARRSKIQ
jgi:hypothetical protein